MKKKRKDLAGVKFPIDRIIVKWNIQAYSSTATPALRTIRNAEER